MEKKSKENLTQENNIDRSKEKTRIVTVIEDKKEENNIKKNFLKTTNGKIILIVTVVIGLGVAGYFSLNYYYNKQYSDCIKEAKTDIEKQRFKEAIDILNNGKELRYTNIDEIALLLSDSYVGLMDYKNALKELLTAYEKTSSKEVYAEYEKVKEEKETDLYNILLKKAQDLEKTSAKKDDIINAYKKAIDANEVQNVPYISIADIYIKSKEYNKGIELLKEGINACNLTNEDIEDEKVPLSAKPDEVASQSIDIFYNKIEQLQDLIIEEKYNKIYVMAQEAYKKENLQLLKEYYNDAVELKSIDDRMYLLLAKSYFELYKYDEALNVLNNGITQFNKSTIKCDKTNLESTLKKYTIIKKKVDDYNKVYKSLYAECAVCLQKSNEKNIIKILKNKTFQEMASVNKETYYKDDDFVEGNISGDNVLIVYANDSIYYGALTNNKRTGKGMFIAVSKENYYMYIGNWNENMPNGNGEVKHIVNGEVDSVTNGTFLKGYENGSMTIKKSYGTMKYTAKNGVPTILNDKNGKKLTTADGNFIIGYYYKDNEKRQVASVPKGTVWKIEGLKY